MKTYLSFLIAAVMAACVTSTFAQGTVVFNNGTGLVKQWASSSDLTLINVPKGGGFVQLFWAPTGTAYTPWTFSLTPAAWYAANPGWILQNPTAPTGFMTPAAGKFNGGSFTLQPLAPGGTIDYVVICWTGNAVSFDAALMSYTSLVLVSSKYTSATGNPTSIPPGIPVPLSASFGGMSLQPIPEPSSFELPALGAATFLVLHRREEQLITRS